MIEHMTEDCQCEGKRCSKCKQMKCCGMFHTNGKYLRANCKLCKQISDRIRWHRDNEAINARRKAQRPGKRDILNARLRAGYAVHGQRYNKNRQMKISSDSDYAERRRASSRNSRAKYGHIYNSRRREPTYREKSHEQERRRAQTEKRILYNRAYKKQHPEQFRAYDKAKFHKRRASKKQTGGSFTAMEWLALKAFYDYTCLCCGRREPEIKLTADHVIPVIKHGSSDIGNIQPLCMLCNCRKHDKVIDYRGGN